jgi:protein-S-isoprenylcysteine O-methyltransferase Ste14
MGRLFAFVYGIIAYALFFLSFTYAIGFVGNLVVPKSVDSGAPGPLVTSLIVDAALLLLFAVQHSGMARRGFKRWLTQWVPQPIERSTYVLLASSVLLLLYWLWRPAPAPVWQVTSPLGVSVLWGVFAFGWLVVFLSTFMIGHFDLFGLKQVWLNLQGRGLPADRFRAPAFYRIVRHPIMVGFLIAFWATPFMSVGHLLFSVATTGYILIAVQIEERDLVAMLGDEYRRYRSRVPGFIPLPRRVGSSEAARGGAATE